MSIALVPSGASDPDMIDAPHPLLRRLHRSYDRIDLNQ
jgi:hypothetical protein